uniref:Uncharacterized protein n=1 Tax=Anopheles culicifacies TaxID=139723 RepID=A0A182LSZ1_9DIPT
MSTEPAVVDTTDSSVIRGSVAAAAFAVRNATVDEEEVYRKLFSSEPQWQDGGDEGGGQNSKGFLNSTLIHAYTADARSTPRVPEADANSSSSSLFGVGASDDDYKGGLLAEVDNSEPASISSRPSDSSRGFQNTFTVLERHLQSKHFHFRQMRRFLQYNESNQTPVFCNVPPSLNDSSNYLRSISEESGSTSTVTSSSSDVDGTSSSQIRMSSDSGPKALFHYNSDEDRPSFLELELEASDRLRRLRERLGGSVPDLPRSCESIESPLVKALYGVSLESLAKNNTDRVHPDPSVFIEDEDKRSLSGEYPDYPYYVARGSNGLSYLKVVHNSSDSGTAGEKGRSSNDDEETIATMVFTVERQARCFVLSPMNDAGVSGLNGVNYGRKTLRDTFSHQQCIDNKPKYGVQPLTFLIPCKFNAKSGRKL